MVVCLACGGHGLKNRIYPEQGPCPDCEGRGKKPPIHAETIRTVLPPGKWVEPGSPGFVHRVPPAVTREEFDALVARVAVLEGRYYPS